MKEPAGTDVLIEHKEEPAVVNVTRAPRITELDGLRGVAILLVLIWHYPVLQIGSMPRLVELFGRLTWSGVDLFFVLSGFLIGGILLDARTSSQYFKTFYVRRFYRIVPIYAVVCILFWVALGLRLWEGVPAFAWLFASPPAMPWFSYATFTQNLAMSGLNSLGPNWLAMTWSLAVEEQFYLALPLMIRFIGSQRLPYILGFFILLAPILRLVCFHFGYPMAAVVLMPCRADALLLGVMAAFLVRHAPSLLFVTSNRKLLVFTIMVTAAVAVRSYAMAPSNPMIYSWLALLYFLVLLAAVTGTHRFFGRVLRARALVGMGVIAYGLYMFHQGISGLCYALIRGKSPQISNFSDFSVMVLATILTFTFAKLSWLYFEKPLIGRSRSYVY